jgi:hypothetical protein
MRKNVIIVEELSSARREKRELTGMPTEHVRVIIIKECDGMTGRYYPGDIIDLPDRRFKSMVIRGLCEQYKGNKKPTRER